MIKEILRAMGAIASLVMMITSISFMKQGLAGNWIAFGLFTLLSLGGMMLAGLTVLLPMAHDFFERGLGRIWLEELDRLNEEKK